MNKPGQTLAIHGAPRRAEATVAGSGRPGRGPAPFARRGAHPLAGPMYWAFADVFALASQLGLGATPPPIQELRRRVDQVFTSLHQRARAAGVPAEDVSDGVYAVMALIDEILLQRDWPGRAEWQASPLQFVHFRENTAGEGFFLRTETLLRQPHRAHVLVVYFLCLGLGFQGRYGVQGVGSLGPIYDAVGAAVAQSLPPSDVLAPRAEPPDLGGTLFKREAPLVRVALAVVGAAVIAFFALRSVLWFEVSGATRGMRDMRDDPALLSPR